MKSPICTSSLVKVFFTFFVLLAGLQASNAQSIPGIYGGGPSSDLGKGVIRYVEFVNSTGNSYTYPLNGILNYVGYYAPANGTFIPGGDYSIQYLNANKTVVTPVATVSYSPNPEYTNGVEVTPPNPGADGALGIQGVVDFDGGPVEGVSARLYSSNTSNATLIAEATTNGDGFFSLYYGVNPNIATGFIPAGTYTLIVGNDEPGCGGPVPVLGAKLTVTYSPTNTTKPDLQSYYVDGAVTNVGTIDAGGGASTNVACPE